MSQENKKRQFGATSRSKVEEKNNDMFHVNESLNVNEQNENRRQSFGASNKKNSSFFENFVKIFHLYDKGEWIKRYLISLIITLFFIAMVNNISWVIVILNFLLFPFIISVVDDFISKFSEKTSYAEQIQNSGCFIANIKVIIKYVFLYFVWGYSFILGLISIVYMYLTARKI